MINLFIPDRIKSRKNTKIAVCQNSGDDLLIHIKLYKMQILYNLGRRKRRDFAVSGLFEPIFAYTLILT